MEIYPPEKRYFRGFRTLVRGNIVYHPAYIVGEDGDCYLAFVITHSPKRGKHHPNHKLKRNPKSTDPRDAYLRPCLVKASKRCFKKEKMDDLLMPKEDDRYAQRILLSKLENKKASP